MLFASVPPPLSCEQARIEQATLPRTFISDVHSTLAGNGTDCGRWDHRAAGASCSPPVRPSCSPSSHPDCTLRSDLRTMVETLHVTTVRSLFRNWQAAIGKARQYPRQRHPPVLCWCSLGKLRARAHGR